MSDEEELEIWDLLHQPLQKENAEKFQKAFSAQESKNNIKKEHDKMIQISKVGISWINHQNKSEKND